MPTSAVKTLTLRIPESLYSQGMDLARQRNQSMNRLLQEGLAILLRSERDRQLFDAFTLAGADPSEAEVEFAQAAQAEVALHAGPD